jgi:hypothetical protein
LQLFAVKLAGVEAVPPRKQSLDFGQPQAPDRFRLTPLVHHSLKVSIEAYVAQRPLVGRKPATR